MKIPESLPWKIDIESLLITGSDGPIIRLQVGERISEAEYIIKAANMLPELVEALHTAVTQNTSLFSAEPEWVVKARELLAKVKED